MFQCATGVAQQIALIGNLYIITKVVMLCQKVNDLLPVIMDVDNKTPETGAGQVTDGTLQHGHTRHFYKRLGFIIGQGPQPLPQSCGKYECFHRLF